MENRLAVKEALDIWNLSNDISEGVNIKGQSYASRDGSLACKRTTRVWVKDTKLKMRRIFISKLEDNNGFSCL